MSLIGWENDKKTTNGCKPCNEFKGVKHIKGAKQLTQVIRKLRKQVTVCSFKETTQTFNNTSGEFLKLPIKAPWPDYSLQCNECQLKYKLSAETINAEKNHSIKGALN